MGSFCRFFRNFLEFSTIFFGKFLRFFGKFSQNFCNFFRLLRFPYDFSPKIFPKIFSENSRSQSVTVQPGSRHYCKFTIKFTPKFTLILIKILQSTKFEGSHFYSFLATFSTPYPLSQVLMDFHNLLSTFITFRNLLRPPKAFPFAAVFSRP